MAAADWASDTAYPWLRDEALPYITDDLRHDVSDALEMIPAGLRGLFPEGSRLDDWTETGVGGVGEDVVGDGTLVAISSVSVLVVWLAIPLVLLLLGQKLEALDRFGTVGMFQPEAMEAAQGDQSRMEMAYAHNLFAWLSALPSPLLGDVPQSTLNKAIDLPMDDFHL